jgi:hypothetical protein
MGSPAVSGSTLSSKAGSISGSFFQPEGGPLPESAPDQLAIRQITGELRATSPDGVHIEASDAGDLLIAALASAARFERRVPAAVLFIKA